MRDEDLLFITADHGCDPSYRAHTDHTREYVPLLAYGKAVVPGVDIGTRSSYADAAQTIAELLGLGPLEHGQSFASLIYR